MPTIKDVAKLAQVSSATVSRILNNDATLSVPEETRRTVLQAAETRNYFIMNIPSIPIYAPY